MKIEYLPDGIILRPETKLETIHLKYHVERIFSAEINSEDGTITLSFGIKEH